MTERFITPAKLIARAMGMRTVHFRGRVSIPDVYREIATTGVGGHNRSAPAKDLSMTNHALTTVLCGLLMAGNIVAASADTNVTSADVTANVEMLGNPYQAKYPSGPCVYARNVWDMCARHTGPFGRRSRHARWPGVGRKIRFWHARCLSRHQRRRYVERSVIA